MEYSSSPGRTKIFISYSHKDKQYLERLTVHLKPMVRKRLIDVWDDTKIIPGAQWREEIKRAIDLAKVAVLLISADFLASDFIVEHELPPLLRKAQDSGATILPVILGPCDFEHSELAQFQSVNRLSQALTKMSVHDQEETWRKVAETIRQLRTQPGQGEKVGESAKKLLLYQDEDTCGTTPYVQEYPNAELSGAALEQLVKALMDAYSTPADLRLLVDFKLNENLFAIVKEDNLETMIYDLVKWAMSRGRMKDLVVGAQERNPGNPKLHKFASENGFAAKSLVLLPNPSQPPRTEKLPKDALFSSNQFKTCPRTDPYYREELFISQTDAQQRGLDKIKCFAILSILPDHPGPPAEQHAVRLIVDPQVQNGFIYVNQHFADKIAFKRENMRSWTIKLAKNIVPLQKAVLEPATEQDDIERECSMLRKQRRDLFTDRCLLVGEKKAMDTLSLYAVGKGYFHLRTIEPDLQTLPPDTVLVFDEQTELELFVSHRKKAVDMVILVDISTSMDCEDYVDANNRVGSRLMGVQSALQTLFNRRLTTGSRLSNIGIIVFAGGPTSWHPARSMTMMEVKNNTYHINDIRSSLQKLNKSYLDKALPRGGTNIVAALQLAADTVNMCSQEGNEKVLLLLSDGADWTRNEDENRYGEIAGTSDDPVVLAENLHYSSDIRIHTVAISNERAFRQHVHSRHWQNKSAIPNMPLLRNIALSTRGIFFESPNAEVLAKLFNEIGQGILYPLMK